MKKSIFCFGDQMTNIIIKSVIAPPVCVFDNFQEVILDSVYLAEHSIQNNSKQFKTMAIVWDAALIYSVKTFHHGRHDNDRNDANDDHQKENDHEKKQMSDRQVGWPSYSWPLVTAEVILCSSSGWWWWLSWWGSEKRSSQHGKDDEDDEEWHDQWSYWW